MTLPLGDRYLSGPLNLKGIFMAGFGFVYILFNPCMPGLLKIGCTNRSPNERARELSNPTGVPDDFRVLAYFELEDFQHWERKIHTDFDRLRFNPSREFFRVSVPDLKRIMDSLMTVADSYYVCAAASRSHQYWCREMGMEAEYPPPEAANA
jgi:hypothetical protein